MTYIKGVNPRVFYVPDSIGESMIAAGHVERATEDEYLAQRNAEPTAPVEDAPPAQDDTTQLADAPYTTDSADDAGDEPALPAEPQDEDGRPAGNASVDVWRDYALAQGYSEEQLDGLKREEIKSLVG